MQCLAGRAVGNGVRLLLILRADGGQRAGELGVGGEGGWGKS